MGNVRDSPNLRKETIHGKRQRISYAVTNMCGWRQFMQDAHICEPMINNDETMSLFAVFDGHGGPEVAKFASDHFLNCLTGNGYFITKNYEKALTSAIMHLDSMMLAKAGSKQLKKIRDQEVQKSNASPYIGQSMAGSTANIVLLTKQYIYCANVGDSRAIAILNESSISLTKGKINKLKFKQLSTDHKPEEEKQRKRIIKAGGFVDFGRINNNLNLSRALGDFAYKNNKHLNPEEQIITAYPEIVKIPRSQAKYILMGCDGIWERKSCQEMTVWLHRKLQQYHNNLSKIIETLLDEEVSQNANEELGMDNMTAILLHLHP